MKPQIKYILLTLFMLLGITQPAQSKITTIIVSFNTVFRPDPNLIRDYIQSKLNLRNYLSLILKGIPTPAETKKLLFTFLATVPTINNMLPSSSWMSEYMPYETEGYKFPSIFCQMLVSTSLQHEQAILARILTSLDRYHGVTSKTRKKILQATIETLFESDLMNKFVNPIHPMIHLLQELKVSYQLILVGNIPGYAWQDMLKRSKMQTLISLFPPTHRYMSGEIQLLKTDPVVFQRILSEHNLDPNECLAIDSNALNLHYPQKIGMQTCAFNPTSDDIELFKKKIIKKLLN